ncbi:hypothetical protein Pst134EA_029499 [Puccinia striiformis f. sp. tritici]|nr:hypothetical protein Pst134EA_029499 [Puccinia striiformis f. sp. tritici]KAH9447463.1 hypothetical protein Pst134EA_029499 [Puccinia striiformis f. sp. tritici]
MPIGTVITDKWRSLSGLDDNQVLRRIPDWRAYRTKLDERMILDYTLFSLGMLIMVSAMPSPQAPKSSAAIKIVQSDDAVIFKAKPCFILGPGKFPFTPNAEVTCITEGTRMIPPIPELTYKGINYSAVHYRGDIITTPIMSAFRLFVIDNRNRVPEQITFLTNSRELYIAMDIAIRSLGNQLPRGNGHLRTCRSIVKVLDFQIARLQGTAPVIAKALGEVLKYCANCSVKEKFDMIMLAAESGISVDIFLDDLDRVGCLTKSQCEEEKKKINNGKELATH